MNDVDFVTQPAIRAPGDGLRELRWRLSPRSLTARLIVGVVSLVVVLVVLIGGGTWFALRYFLAERLDQQLQTTASGQLDLLFRSTPRSGLVLRAPQNVWAVALTPQGELITYSPNASVESLQLSAADRAMLAGRTSIAPVTVETTNGLQLRVTTRSATASSPTGDEAAIAVIGLSTGEEQRTLDRLVSLELVIGASAVGLALGATSYGVRFSLRRLRGVTATAQEVAAELSPEGTGLDRRVPVTEEGTEVGQLAESMNTLLAAVETQFAARVESEERMRRFLADASHELRTPLTSIRGFAELARMQRAVDTTYAGRVDDNLDRIESEGMRMSRLVEDLLMLARGDRGAPPSRELIDISDLIGDAVSSARAAFPARRIEIGTMPPYQVIGDNDQLLRVVRNLINNAAVHTRAEAPIMVRAFADGVGVAVQVIDGGPGLPPDEAAHVFERFWRADKARTRARGGTGLGLPIVASIVAAHGGTVHFESTIEAGSTVTVWLPAVDAAGYDE